MLVLERDGLMGATWNIPIFDMWLSFIGSLQYYLEQNLDARQRELEREEELEAKGPTVKAKSKMSKVCHFVIQNIIFNSMSVYVSVTSSSPTLRLFTSEPPLCSCYLRLI